MILKYVRRTMLDSEILFELRERDQLNNFSFKSTIKISPICPFEDQNTSFFSIFRL